MAPAKKARAVIISSDEEDENPVLMYVLNSITSSMFNVIGLC